MVQWWLTRCLTEVADKKSSGMVVDELAKAFGGQSRLTRSSNAFFLMGASFHHAH